MNKPRIRFEGSRVILISKEYSACELDPLWNSIHACAGTTVGRTRDSGIPVRVKWDNGATNAYRLEDLEVYTDEKLIDNPNMSFKRAKKTVKESENPCISINCEEFKDVLDNSDHSTEVKKCVDDFERKKKRMAKLSEQAKEKTSELGEAVSLSDDEESDLDNIL